MIATEINLLDFSKTFSRFQSVVGEEHWINRVLLIGQEAKGHPHLKDLLDKENSLALKLDELTAEFKKYGLIRRRTCRNVGYYPAIALVTQFLSLYDYAPDEKKSFLLRRIQSSFNNPNDLRSIRVEFSAATHFARRGYTLTWPEMEGIGNFDLLVEDLGENGLEIECKSISEQTGRKISTRDALNFFNEVRQTTLSTSGVVSGGLAVVLTVNAKISNVQADLLRAIKQILLGENEIQDRNFNIKAHKFGLSMIENLDFSQSNPATRKLIDQITQTENRESMIVGNSKRAIVFILKHEDSDTTLRKIYSTLKDSASRQPTKTRPVFYIVGFEDISKEQLVEIASQDLDANNDPTGICIATSRFLNSQERNHVAGIGYLSTCDYEQTEVRGTVGAGSIYFFTNKESPMWHENMEGLFKS